jgi:DDE superfamily endonuclease
MTTEPYSSARRVYWVADNGSSHRGQAAARRLQGAWPTLRLVHLPIHTSWLNQVEVYFSVIQRKLLTPTTSAASPEAEAGLLAFQDYYQQIATPFQWKFTTPTSTSCSSSSLPTNQPRRSQPDHRYVTEIPCQST